MPLTAYCVELDCIVAVDKMPNDKLGNFKLQDIDKPLKIDKMSESKYKDEHWIIQLHHAYQYPISKLPKHPLSYSYQCKCCKVPMRLRIKGNWVSFTHIEDPKKYCMYLVKLQEEGIGGTGI